MKVVKIFGLLITGMLCNPVQSMELPTQYPLEEQLFDGIISVNDYLLTLEHTSEYGAMLADLRTAQYMPGNNLYTNFRNGIQNQLLAAQNQFANTSEEQIAAEELWEGQVTKQDIKKALIQYIYESVRNTINSLYNQLQTLMRMGQARLGKNT